MNNRTELAIQKTGLSGIGAPARSEIMSILNNINCWDEGRHAIAARLPTAVERSMLQARGAELEQYLMPFAGDKLVMQNVKRSLAEFFAGYPSLMNADAPGMVTAYVNHLKEFPAWAVTKALAQIIGGQVFDHDPKTGRKVPLDPDWPPSSMRIAMVCRSIIKDPAEELAKILRLMRAKPAPPERTDDRKVTVPRVRQMADEARRVLNPSPTDEQTEKAKAAAMVAAEEKRQFNRAEAERQWIAHGYEPVENPDGSLSSVSFLKSMHMWPPQGAVKISDAK